MVIYYAYAGQVISWELWGEHDMNEYTHTQLKNYIQELGRRDLCRHIEKFHQGDRTCAGRRLTQNQHVFVEQVTI